MNDMPKPTPPGVDIFEPPNFLKAKVKVLDAPVEEIIGNANRSLAELRTHYETWTLEEVGRLYDLLARRWTKDTERALASDMMRRTANDMRGRGGTFEYPLISQIAESLCEYLGRVTPAEQREDIIRAHLDAIQAVIRQKIQGPGDATAQAIVTGLRKAALR